MTPKQFTIACETLKEEAEIIDGMIEALKQRCIEFLPFKVGDCVSVKNHELRSVPKAWITKIELATEFKQPMLHLTVVEPKKDGTPSKLKRELAWINPENVKLIKEER